MVGTTIPGGSTERDGFIISRVIEEVSLDSLDVVLPRATPAPPAASDTTAFTSQPAGVSLPPIVLPNLTTLPAVDDRELANTVTSVSKKAVKSATVTEEVATSTLSAVRSTATEPTSSISDTVDTNSPFASVTIVTNFVDSGSTATEPSGGDTSVAANATAATTAAGTEAVTTAAAITTAATPAAATAAAGATGASITVATPTAAVAPGMMHVDGGMLIINTPPPLPPPGHKSIKAFVLVWPSCKDEAWFGLGGGGGWLD